MSEAQQPSVDGLTPKQEMAIIALLSEGTIKAAAEKVGVTERTMHRWFDEQPFSAAYSKARRRAFTQSIGLAQKFTHTAVGVLVRVMTDAKTPPAARVSASCAVLKFNRESIELDDMAGRIEALEEQARKVAEAGERRAG